MPESTPDTAARDPVRIGLVSVSDRASTGVYEDKGIPALRDWLGRALLNPIEWETRLIPDEQVIISATLRELVDDAHCDIVLTTGGTGPAPRDVTPEATLAIATKEMPGFGEQMRRIGLAFVPTAILSRQVAVIRGKALVINLPGQPKAIAETLEGMRDATPPVPGIFAAVPYCIDLIGGPYLETDEAVCKAFRPKSAVRAMSAPTLAAAATALPPEGAQPGLGRPGAELGPTSQGG
jgi:molybdopterin adenylyltransferase